MAQRAGAGFRGLWDAPIFHPTRSAFAFSEPLLLEGLAAAPIFWLGASPVLAHNLVLLAALVANGGFGFALARRLGAGAPAAVAAGALLCLLPYVHHELGVLTLVPLAGVLATLQALLAFAGRPAPGRGLRLGAAFGATYLLCGQYALFLLLAGAPAALCLLRRELFAPRSLLAAALAAVVAGALLWPVASRQLEARREHGFERGGRSAVLGSAEPAAFLLAPVTPRLPFPGVRAVPEARDQAHFPGALKLGLAALGLAFCARRRELRRAGAFLAALAAGGVALSVLPRLELAGVTPFAGLREALPGLAQVRSLWRATVFMQLAVALLAALGLEALARAARRPPRPALRRCAAAGVALLAALACVELWPAPPLLSPAPSREAWRPWLDWIGEHLPPDAPLVHLPPPASESVVDYEETARAMLLATAHGRPLLNGYSSYFPRAYRAFARIMRGCPTPAAWGLLHEVGLRVLSVRSSWLAADPRCGPPPQHYRRAAAFPQLDVELWQAVTPAAPAPAGTPGAP